LLTGELEVAGVDEVAALDVAADVAALDVAADVAALDVAALDVAADVAALDVAALDVAALDVAALDEVAALADVVGLSPPSAAAHWPACFKVPAWQQYEAEE
jgi:hypothetical protein